MLQRLHRRRLQWPSLLWYGGSMICYCCCCTSLTHPHTPCLSPTDGGCGGHESWFLADREAWERDVGLSAAPGGNGTRARRVRDRLLAAARGALGAELRAAARGRGALVVSMANGPHVGLALNMVRRTISFPSLAPRRFSSLEPVVARRTRRGGAGAPRSSSSRSPGPRRATSPPTASRPRRSPSRTRRRSRRGATSRAAASGASRY